MSNTSPDSFFDALEAQFNQLAIAVASGDADALPVISSQVHELSVNLNTVWQQWQRQGLASHLVEQRVRALAEGMQVVRANLLRRMTLIEQTLRLVVPATEDPTYAGGGAYGAGPRASGRLPSMSA